VRPAGWTTHGFAPADQTGQTKRPNGQDTAPPIAGIAGVTGLRHNLQASRLRASASRRRPELHLLVTAHCVARAEHSPRKTDRSG
jgi:hypothetical protein